MKDESLAVLADALRCPLSTMMAAVDALLLVSTTPHSLRASERAARAATQMGLMVSELIDYARDGRLALMTRREPIDLTALCHQIVEDFELTAPRRPIDLSIEGAASGEWDRARLSQAISNMLGYALHRGRGETRLSVMGDCDAVVFAVVNDGEPSPSGRASSLFEGGDAEFVGLFIVDVIARLSGGSFAVESTAGGTTFKLRLPRQGR